VPPRVRAAIDRRQAIEVVEVVAGSPAERAGLRPEDLIVALDGEPLGDVGDLQRRMTAEVIGRELALDVIRDGVQRTLRVTPDELA
jgi:S1-C subfamily serine protease